MHKLVVERLFTRCQDMQGKITSFIVIHVIDSVVAESKKIAFLCSNTIRYDTRYYFNVRSKADISQLNLPHRTDN